MPDIGAVASARFHSLAGVECRRFDFGVEDRDVRLINGVRPEEADSERISGPGSENRTRFLLERLGVAGGVAIPCGSEIAD